MTFNAPKLGQILNTYSARAQALCRTSIFWMVRTSSQISLEASKFGRKVNDCFHGAIRTVRKSWISQQFRLVLERGKTREDRKEWRDRKISLPWIFSLLFIEAGIIAAITSLLTVSNRNSGFVTLNDAPTFLLGHPMLAKKLWTEGALYTVLPTFLMTCYNKLLREGTVSALLDRQPYVALKAGGPPQVTIMLEYSKVDGWKRGWKAFRNRHYTLFAYILVGHIYSILMIPLTAYLFDDAHFVANRTLAGLVTKEFDGLAFSLRTDLKPALDSVTAVNLYGANSPAWVSNQHAFLPFSLPDRLQTGNVTAITTAYSARLSCEIMAKSDYTAEITDAEFKVTGIDRGCRIYATIQRPLVPMTFLSTWAEQSCGAANGFSRLAILAGQFTSRGGEAPSNTSLISCTPTYWITPGNLTVAIGFTPEPLIVQFSHEAQASKPILFESWTIYEEQLQALQGFNVQSNLEANEFGRLVYSLSSQIDRQSPLMPEKIKNATEIVFSSVFSTFSSSNLFTDRSTPSNTTLLVTESQTRLIVIPQVAYAILAMISCALALTVVMIFYSSKKSILLEEPIGIFGSAAILYQSNVGEKLKDIVKRSSTFQGNFAGRANELYDLRAGTCIVDTKHLFPRKMNADFQNK